jgi:hypothetical protein
MAHSYAYEFYKPGSSEDTVATFSTDEPLPHIEVGHSLMLESDSYSTKIGYELVIVHVRTYLFVQKGFVIRQGTSVYLTEKDRGEILPR